MRERLAQGCLIGAAVIVALGPPAWILTRAGLSEGQAVSNQTKAVLGSAKGVLDETQSTVKNTGELIKDVKDSFDDMYWDMKATMANVATTSKDMDDLVHDVRASLVGGKDLSGTEREGLLVAATGLVGDARKLTGDLDRDVNELTSKAGAALDPLATVLKNLAALESDLDEQIKQGSVKAFATIDAATKAINDVDKILDGDEIKGILEHAQGTAANVEHSTESLKIAFERLRKKAAFVKMLLEKAFGLVKLVIKL